MLLGRNNKYSLSHSALACLFCFLGWKEPASAEAAMKNTAMELKITPSVAALRRSSCRSSASFQETLSFCFRAEEQGEATPDFGGSTMCSIPTSQGEEGQPSCPRPAPHSLAARGILLISQSWCRFSQESLVSGTDPTLISLGKGFNSFCLGGQGCRANLISWCCLMPLGWKPAAG